MTAEDFGALVRNILQAIGGVFIAKGVMSDGDVALYSGAVLSIATLVWSVWQKKSAAKKMEVAKEIISVQRDQLAEK